MRPQGATFWLLDGQTGWRSAELNNGQTSAVSQSGIRLPANPAGPLALTTESVGNLTLPRGFALSREGILYILPEHEPGLKRFDPTTQRFVPLPTIGQVGSELRQFSHPRNIAIAANNLYVADSGNHRVQVFDRNSLALRDNWQPQPDWNPYDVTAQGKMVYILDRRYGRVYRHRPGVDSLQCLVDEPTAANRWSRLLVDRDGRIYLLVIPEEYPENPQALPYLKVYDRCGQRLKQEKKVGDDQPEQPPRIKFEDNCDDWLRGEQEVGAGQPAQPCLNIFDAGAVRDRFDLPLIRQDSQGRFHLPAKLTGATPLPADEPVSLYPLWAKGGLIFDRDGNPARVAQAELAGPRLFKSQGTWLSEALDSKIYNCQWHRVELDTGLLPAGSRLVVSTYTSNQPLSTARVRELPAHLWDTNYTISGQMQPPPEDDPAHPPPKNDFLILSREGQYLWLKIQLISDGYSSPLIEAIRVHYPRQSYLEYLPAIYSADEESRGFMERFLSVFQTEWDKLDYKINDIAAYFDPEAVPEGNFLTWLAGWLALPLEGSWNWAQKRRLLVAAPKIIPQRGTLAGLQRYLQIYLENMTGLTFAESERYPQIVEGFVERRYFMLSTQDTAVLGRPASLWGPAVVGRLQLDSYAQVGEVKLVSTGDPQCDIFHHFAHRFRVFVPSAWVKTEADERLLRRALDEEKPAHTQYDLCLVEPRLRVGLQSTVGLDTIIGDYPLARLACLHQNDRPPSQPPRQRLGFDTVLAGEPVANGSLVVGSQSRVGLNTILS